MHDSHMPCRAARRGEAHLVAWDRRQPPTIDAARTTALASNTHARLRKLRPQLGAALAAGGADDARFHVRQPDVIRPASALISTEWLQRWSRQSSSTSRTPEERISPKVIFCGQARHGCRLKEPIPPSSLGRQAAPTAGQTVAEWQTAVTADLGARLFA
jgi:hypothetical protein